MTYESLPNDVIFIACAAAGPDSPALIFPARNLTRKPVSYAGYDVQSIMQLPVVKPYT